ncbi:MAG: hypothetical protein KGI54_16475 [Pseudomonadota bacterium]|nr:hypothetical protein [Pseudomonadota bacterium]
MSTKSYDGAKCYWCGHGTIQWLPDPDSKSGREALMCNLCDRQPVRACK